MLECPLNWTALQNPAKAGIGGLQHTGLIVLRQGGPGAKDSIGTKKPPSLGSWGGALGALITFEVNSSTGSQREAT